jgi:magnesium transporter
MDSTTRLILPDVKEALANDPAALVELTDELLPADLADLAAQLEPELAQQLVRVLPEDVAARLLEACGENQRRELFAEVAAQEVTSAAAITAHMAADDRADLYAALSEDLRASLLSAMAPEQSRDIRALLAYPEDSAGGRMTTDFVALSAETTVAQAIEKVRSLAEEMETIYLVYVVDRRGILVGVVSLRDLVTSPANAKIEEVMNPNVVTVSADTDQEEVAHVMSKYDLLALPVVDHAYRLVGMITVDDVMDVVEEEATEDAHRLGAIEPIEAPFLTTSLWEFIKARGPWLLALFIVQFMTASVLEHYSSGQLPSATMLMWFVPLIISSGGNAGTQSATLVIRALAVGEVVPATALRVLVREIAVGGTLGAVLGFVGAGRVLLLDATRSASIALAVGLSVTAVVLFGSLLGAGIPLLFERMRIDPAVSSTPFIASIMDICALLIYFRIALFFLG